MAEGAQRWIAVYTRPHFEWTVAHQLEDRGLVAFVPAQRRRHVWSDRTKWVDVPLIPSYAFVCLSPTQHHRLYDISGLVRPIMFHGRVAIIRETEMELLRKAEQHPETEAVAMHSGFMRGSAVQVTGGLFAGYRGVVMNSQKSCTVAISIEELSYAVVVSVNATDVQVM